MATHMYMPQTPSRGLRMGHIDPIPSLPAFDADERLVNVVRELSLCVST